MVFHHKKKKLFAESLNIFIYLAVLLNLSQILLDFLLAGLVLPLHAGFGESLLLGFRPASRLIFREGKITHCRGERRGNRKENIKQNVG